MAGQRLRAVRSLSAAELRMSGLSEGPYVRHVSKRPCVGRVSGVSVRNLAALRRRLRALHFYAVARESLGASASPAHSRSARAQAVEVGHAADEGELSCRLRRTAQQNPAVAPLQLRNVENHGH